MWLKPQGHGTIFNAGQPSEEFDTMTCGHCQFISVIKPGQRPEDCGGLCKQCMQLICSKCVDKMTCDPFLRKLERIEAHDRFIREAGLE